MIGSSPRLRPGRADDIEALVALENRCFDSDRMARRNFAWMLRGANAVLQVATCGDVLAGYVLVLFRKGTSRARIYSIAVNPELRGRGVAAALLAAAEEAARAAGSAWMYLEVRPDNQPAIRLYEKNGYRRFGVLAGFYEDGTDALRLEKRLQ